MIIYSHGREGSKRPQMPRYYGSHGEWEPKKMLPEGPGKTALFFYKKFEKGVDRIGRPCYNTGTVEDTPERGERLDRLTRSLDTS